MVFYNGAKNFFGYPLEISDPRRISKDIDGHYRRSLARDHLILQAMTVVALEKISAWAIEGAALVDLSRRYPALALACLEHLSARILYYVQLVEDLGLRSVQSRIAHTLLNHAELRDGVLIVPRRSWTTLDEMATRLGTVRDVLSRSLNVLETEGILHLERSQIVILDPQKLLERGKA